MEQSAVLSRSLQRGYVQCLACEHWCALAPGAIGKCGVRQNAHGELQLLVYGRAAAAQVDPVEKKPLHHFLPGRSIFSIGTVGCNLRCRWCQNWQISQWRNFDPVRDAIGSHLPPAEIVAYCRERAIPLIAFTYNEPAVFFEYAYDTAKLAYEYGIRTVFVSSGFETLQALEQMTPFLDAVNVDLKTFRDETYRTYCGARLAPVLRNIEHLVAQGKVWTEVTTLVIPDLNDSDAELKEIAAFLAGLSLDIPWHVTAFTPQYRLTDRGPTPPETVLRAHAIGRAAGLRYVYTGNIWYDTRLQASADTRCPHCNALLIQRAGYRVAQKWREPGICHSCGAQIAGIWQ